MLAEVTLWRTIVAVLTFLCMGPGAWVTAERAVAAVRMNDGPAWEAFLHSILDLGVLVIVGTVALVLYAPGSISRWLAMWFYAGGLMFCSIAFVGLAIHRNVTGFLQRRFRRGG